MAFAQAPVAEREPRSSGDQAITHVPVLVSRFLGARVAWLNRRWFAKAGLDVFDDHVIECLCSNLTGQFAYGVVTSDAAAQFDTSNSKTFWADRYGGGGLERHGGSGRAATYEGIQVKGVGSTPLVGDVRTWAYSHGCVWLEEALREAIFAEVVDEEFPHGGSAVIAVIDCGYSYVHPDGASGERRALVLRTETTRLAHLQRAALFKEGADRETFSDHGDVNRVAHHFRALGAASCEGRTQGVAKGLSEALAKAADQALFSRVSRIFTGGPYSSSFSVSGELVDFGSFTSLPDWSSAASNLNAPSLGMERRILLDITRSLAFYARKYGDCSSINAIEQTLPVEVSAVFDQAERKSFDVLFGLDPEKEPELSAKVFNTLGGYFLAQQQNQVNHSLGMRSALGWIHAELQTKIQNVEVPVSEPVMLLHDALFSSEEVSEPGLKQAMFCAAARHLTPRPLLDRTTLQGAIHGMLVAGAPHGGPGPDEIADFAASTLSRSRRFWPGLPRNLIVLAQKFDGVTACLTCVHAGTGLPVIALHALGSGGGLVVFDRRFPGLGDEASTVPTPDGKRTWILVDHDGARPYPIVEYALNHRIPDFRYLTEQEADSLVRAPRQAPFHTAT